MERTHIGELGKKVGEEVLIKAWVHIRRDQGKLIFFDFRDKSGFVQGVILPNAKEAHEVGSKLRSEWVVEVKGKINKRPDKNVNAGVQNGDIELEILAITVLSEAATPPLPLDTNGTEIDEEVRMKYRYLDLRRRRMLENLMLRHKVSMLVRNYLTGQGFTEIETPTLTKTAPEGARDFLVPSRYSPGEFYALPQSPQQYKQLLMIAGVERYFQLAHAFRDEDLRGDRQFEHTQIDLEMSFATEKDVRDMVEGMMIHVVESCGKKVMQKPFPVFTHEEAMAKFGADKFDLRPEPKDPNLFAFAWVIDFPLFEWDETSKRFTFAHNPFSAPKAADVANLMAGEDFASLHAQQYDLVGNGFELASGGVRISDPVVQRKVFEIMGLTPEQTEERFGHLIHAYEYGAPPHAGMAPGLDRLVMLLANEKDIREVIAFPMSSTGQTSVMSAPSEVPPESLRDLGITVKKKS